MRDLSALGATSLGVWTRQQALELLRPGQVDALVRTGAWQVLWRGVYADGGYALDAEQQAVAAVLAVAGRLDAGAAASSRSAARVWQLPLVDDLDPATGADEHRQHHVVGGRRLPHQVHSGAVLLPSTARTAPEELVRRTSGLLVTRPARTLLDCARVLSAQALVCAVDDGLRRRVVERRHLDALASRPRLRGAPALQEALLRADARSESPPETLARLLLLPVLPGLVPQYELWADGRQVARFDLGDPAVRLAVEVDGKRGHAGPVMVAKDRRRDRRTEALGWVTERTTWWELRCRPTAVRQRILARHARLQAALAA